MKVLTPGGMRAVVYSNRRTRTSPANSTFTGKPFNLGFGETSEPDLTFNFIWILKSGVEVQYDYHFWAPLVQMDLGIDALNWRVLGFRSLPSNGGWLFNNSVRPGALVDKYPV